MKNNKKSMFKNSSIFPPFFGILINLAEIAQLKIRPRSLKSPARRKKAPYF